MPETTQEITGRMVEAVMPPMIRALRDCEVVMGIPPEPEVAPPLAQLRQYLWGLVNACVPIIQEIDASMIYYRRYARALNLRHALEKVEEELANTASPMLQPLPGQGIPVTDPSQLVYPPRRRMKTQQDTLNRLAEQILEDTHATE